MEGNVKQIRLHSLALRDFKGMTFTLSPQGDDTDVFGRNATGKTTIADAVSWLLFDKDSLGRANFEIKNLDRLGQAEHGLEHAVEGEFNVEGTTYVLTKVYREKWERKRGSAQATFSGNTTLYYVNKVPVKQKDYVSLVAELAGDESVFRLLTTPTAFPALHWMKQREIILEVCGGMTDSEVIAAHPELMPLTDLLAPHRQSKTPFDDLKKVIAARKTEINKELERLPVRIDECKRMMPDVAGLNLSELNARRLALEDMVSECQLKLQGIDNGGAIAELSKELQGLKCDIGELQNTYYLEGMKKVRQMNQGITEVQDGVTNIVKKVENLKNNLRFKKELLGTLDKKLERLRARFMEVDGEVFNDTTEDTCAACGHPLDPDKVEAARAKALAAFNRSKAERLDDIDRSGMASNGERENILNEITKLEDELAKLEDPDRTELDALIAERDALKARAEDYTFIPGRAEMLEKQTALEKQIEAARAGVSQDKDAIQTQIDELNADLTEAKEKADRFTRREQGEARIEELKRDEKRLAAEYEKLEGQLYLCEQFIQAKVSMLTEKINALFELARFKLFDVQVNGGISECCEITVDGVPFNGGLNNAARINAGLDVCRTLARHYGLLAPVFVDNAESVCELIDMDAQVIRLVVSEPDKVLRVEPAKKRMAA